MWTSMKGMLTAANASRSATLVVREGCRIDDDVCSFVAFRRMNALDQGCLGIALERLHVDPALPSLAPACVDGLQRVLPIMLVSRWPRRFRFGPWMTRILGMGGEFAASRARCPVLAEFDRGACAPPSRAGISLSAARTMRLTPISALPI
jgi:hypothetical protein